MSSPWPTALLVVSDRAARGERADETAEALRPVLAEHGFDLVHVRVVPVPSETKVSVTSFPEPPV